jgi:isocitrate/isopropylmalate dehydrogenase
MLCRWSLGRTDVAEAIEAAVSRALDDGFRTADLIAPHGGAQVPVSGGLEMARAVVDRIAIPRAAPEAAAARTA